MYDARNEPHEFVAEDRDEAIAKACEFFGLNQQELAIADLPAGEVFGLANRVAVVAVPRDRKPPAGGGGRGEGRRDRDRDRGERRDAGGRGDRDRGRDRGRDRDRGRGGDRGNRRDAEPRGESRERSEVREPRPEPPRLEREPQEPSVGMLEGEVGEVGRFVAGVLERMDLGPFGLSQANEEGLVVLSVRGAAAPNLAGEDGRTVDALQLLANQAAARLEEEPPRVVLDVEGDAEAREDRLTRLAERVAKRARDMGRTVRLDPMNGRDRRQIHLALRDDPEVATMSTGEGRYRQVLVVPKGAPEFEQARREAEAAASRAEHDE
jgi:spoIIIJ-associated protein